MAISPKVLLVELVMSIDRMIESARIAPVVPGEWTPATVLGHVSEVDTQVWAARVDLMLNAAASGSPEPEFAWWEPDPVKTAEKFSSVSVEDASAIALQARTQLVTKLSGLSEEQWQARAIHKTFGSITIAELIFHALQHDEEHRGSFVK